MCRITTIARCLVGFMLRLESALRGSFALDGGFGFCVGFGFGNAGWLLRLALDRRTRHCFCWCHLLGNVYLAGMEVSWLSKCFVGVVTGSLGLYILLSSSLGASTRLGR